MDEQKKRKLKISLGDIFTIACIVGIVTKSAGYLIRAIKMPNGNKISK